MTADNPPAVYACPSGQRGSDVVSIPDPALEAIVRKALKRPKGSITRSHMLMLDQLDASRLYNPFPPIVTSLEGLQHAKNLVRVSFQWHYSIKDLRPLAGLTQLRSVEMTGNRISDLRPLAKLTQLRNLQIGGNQIVSVAPLRNLVNLESVQLNGNRIRDVRPLNRLRNLTLLVLSYNEIENPLLPLLPKLRELKIVYNNIRDITPLLRLKSLKYLAVYYNDLDLEPGSKDMAVIARLQARGIRVRYVPQNPQEPREG